MIEPTTDAAALAALHARCFPDQPWAEPELDAMLRTPGTAAWLAWREGRPAGFLMVRTDGESADILTLGTDPAHRRQGIAASLLAEAAQALRARGCARLVLEVGAENRAAYALYGRLGYRILNRRAGYYAHADAREDALVMEYLL